MHTFIFHVSDRNKCEGKIISSIVVGGSVPVLCHCFYPNNFLLFFFSFHKVPSTFELK